jgi:hypothetical protein
MLPIEAEPEVAWLQPVCFRCGWQGVPCRMPWEIAAEPVECPVCGSGVGAEVRKGSWRVFSRSRVAGLRRRR